jgi:hypothetical protein
MRMHMQRVRRRWMSYGSIQAITCLWLLSYRRASLFLQKRVMRHPRMALRAEETAGGVRQQLLAEQIEAVVLEGEVIGAESLMVLVSVEVQEIGQETDEYPLRELVPTLRRDVEDEVGAAGEGAGEDTRHDPGLRHHLQEDAVMIELCMLIWLIESLSCTGPVRITFCHQMKRNARIPCKKNVVKKITTIYIICRNKRKSK